MDFDAYKVTSVQYPDQPKKPDAPRPTGVGRNAVQPTPTQYREYADALETYEKEMVAFREGQRLYREEETRLMALFYKDAIDDVGLTGHPKADKAYSLAWEHGHASGLYEVHSWLQELAELVKD